MWSYPPTAVNADYENITFGMDASHICANPKHSKDALVAQCPIVVLKASTVLQSLGIIASRILLPSSDTQGEARERTYCPTTWNYAYGYDAPAQYSDSLFESGAPAILAHECVLSVTAQMSNKIQQRAPCANALSPFSISSGVRTDAESHSRAQTQGASTCQARRYDLSSIEDMREVLNKTLSLTKDFVKVPEARAECRILHFKPESRRQHKTCPEQDCEELLFTFNQRKSMINLELHEEPEWKDRVEAFKKGGTSTLGRILDVGAEGSQERMESRQFEEITEHASDHWKNVELIPSKKLFLGETLVMRMWIQTFFGQSQRTILVQLVSLESFRKMMPSSICSGSNLEFKTSTRSRMKDCVVLTAT